MYLIHQTSYENLKKILNTKYLKASYLTKIIDQGNGIYDYKNQKYIFFNIIDSLFRNFLNSDVVLYFDKKMLYNRNFWVNDEKYDPNPEKENKKYPQYYKKINELLKKKFKKSLKKSLEYNLENVYYVYHQLSIKNKVNLKNLIAIKFNKKKPSKKIINKLHNEYKIKIL